MLGWYEYLSKLPKEEREEEGVRIIEESAERAFHNSREEVVDFARRNRIDLSVAQKAWQDTILSKFGR